MGKARDVVTSIDVPAKTRSAMVDLLNQHLADTLDLYSQIKQAHWNVRGANFIALHELFDRLAETVEGQTDEIAERATALGGVALGTARMTAAASRLAEYPAGAVDGKEHVRALAERLAALAKSTRKAIDKAARQGDAGTADLFTQASRELDKGLWLLEAHVQK